jgi:peptidoglycan/xylan/chitin deacetylase (PgdA/CDA1 family)
MPARFSIARILGPSYSLRCLVFHNISSSDSPFTKGINVSTPLEEFEAALRFLTAYYTPVRLDQVLANSHGRTLPARAVLVTFDDAYASVAELAAPLCQKFEVPALFFVNAAFVDNQRLAPDNLVCYVANMLGMKPINAAAQAVQGTESPELRSLAEMFGVFLPSLTLAEREEFLETLEQMAGINNHRLLEESSLYLSSNQLRALASFDFEIGNHTYSHVHCRALSQSDFAQEIAGNKAELEAVSRTRVRSFSLPYGSSKDLTSELKASLQLSGHEAVFLSESVANSRGAESFRLDRVNPRSDSDGTLFMDLEVLPRLRLIRNRLLQTSSPTAGRALRPS